MMTELARYNRHETYEWNYEHAPMPLEQELAPLPGEWQFCGLPVNSPLGVPAGPLLNGRWCLYYASLGFDVVTYKTVRSRPRDCYQLPNLQPVVCGPLEGGESDLPASQQMQGSWAVSYGMPSRGPADWQEDIRQTREQLGKGQILNVSVVGSVLPEWDLQQLADDYAECARLAVESGADTVETNLSCPNVSTCDGQLYQVPSDAAIVLQTVREAIGSTPLIAKVGRIMDSESAERLLESVHPFLDAMAMTNSIASTVVDTSGQRLFDGERRGICGKATLAASVQQTRMVAKILAERDWSMDLIGVGGASCLEDVKSYLGAGAHAVHLATAAMVNPQVGMNIRRAWDG